MSTIKDIAKEAGVSIATVSIVLNGKGKERKISKETQSRIYTIAQQLNYVPNQSAKKLRAAQKDSYAVAFYLARITLGIQQEIMNLKKNIRLTVIPYKVDHLEEQMKSTQNDFFNGIIIANMSNTDMEFLNTTYVPPCPVVLFNRESPKFSSVTMDNYKVGQNVARHFLAKGLFDAGVLTHDTTFPIMRQWMQGFLDTYKEEGHPIGEDRIYLCETSSASAFEICKRLAAEGTMPKAMFCESDVLAHGMLFA